MMLFLPLVIEIRKPRKVSCEGYPHLSLKQELFSHMMILGGTNHLVEGGDKEVTGKFVICSEREGSIYNLCLQNVDMFVFTLQSGRQRDMLHLGIFFSN